ncbi:phage tail protein [Agarivorans sp. Z349TD_8]|uniref:phage tail protein n=1 Tax=Agarivorans sp. Z349TD_8 TaxID=3421434 RepID=UPI003D7D1D6B
MDPFIGQIKMFAGPFAPRNWALCDGQLLPISPYTKLFSLIGTFYGGNGRSSFALPDMRGRLSMNYGQGPGLTNRLLGSRFGVESVNLTANELPTHTHALQASTLSTQSASPEGRMVATPDTGETLFVDFDSAKQASLRENIVKETGAGQVHTNEMPFLCVNFIIALEGIYPSRN